METKQEETVTKVLEALESIRPFLNKDGGDIELVCGLCKTAGKL